MKRRFGKIYFSFEQVEKHSGDVSLILSQIEFVPVKVEALWHMMHFEYIGISPMFDEINEGDITPEYTIELFESSVSEVRRS